MERNRKQLGAYYTPKSISLPIADWAIDDSDTSVIDPTFGGCSFIESSLKVLAKKGNSSPEKNVYGADIDPLAFEHLRKLIPKYSEDRFIYGDFFDAEFDVQFDAIIGNPPYIKHDNIPRAALKKARSRIDLGDWPEKLIRPNYWVYFILFSLKMLKEDGKMAFILPMSFINSNYSTILIEKLRYQFRSIDAFPLVDKVFDGTDESTVVVLFNGRKATTEIGKYEIHELIRSSDLSSEIKSLSSRRTLRISRKITDDRNLLDIKRKYDIKYLSEFFTVKIGIVTGDKEFFISSKQEWEKREINPDFLFPVFSKASDLQKIIVREKDIMDLPQILVIPEMYKSEGLFFDPALDKYLKGASDKTTESYHAKHRNPWYALRRIIAGDAYIKNIVSGRVLIHANLTGAFCTNNIIRLNLIADCDVKILSLFTATSLFQLSAYLSGNIYGKKGLKLDPQHISRLILPYVNVISPSDGQYIEEMIGGSENENQFEIDEILLGKYVGIHKGDIKYIQESLSKIKSTQFS